VRLSRRKSVSEHRHEAFLLGFHAGRLSERTGHADDLEIEVSRSLDEAIALAQRLHDDNARQLRELLKAVGE
jgi:hypothetical protein